MSNAKNATESMSLQELQALLELKKMTDGIDVGALENFGIDPKNHNPEHLKVFSKAATNSIKDGRVNMTIPTYLRTHPTYKIYLNTLKKTHGVLPQHLFTAVIEAIITGDITVQRINLTKSEAEAWGSKKRTVLIGRDGKIINKTNNVDRPDGVRI